MFVEEYLVDLRRRRFTPGAWRDLLLRSARLAHAEALRRPEAVRSLALTGLGGLLVLLLPAAALALQGRGPLALDLFRDTALTLIAGLLLIVGSLRLLRKDDGTPLERLNLANLLTLARLVSIPAFWNFFAAGEMRLAILTFGLGALTDVADGVVARVGRQRTTLGRLFDPFVDIVFNAVLVLALARLAIVPAWILGLVAARYGLLVVGAVAITLFRGPVEIRPTILGKTTGVISTLLLVVLAIGALSMGAPVSGAPFSGEGTAGAFARLAPLLTLMLGIVEALTIPQVLLIGWLNLRRVATARADGTLRLVTLPQEPPEPRTGDSPNDRDPWRVPRV